MSSKTSITRHRSLRNEPEPLTLSSSVASTTSYKDESIPRRHTVFWSPTDQPAVESLQQPHQATQRVQDTQDEVTRSQQQQHPETAHQLLYVNRWWNLLENETMDTARPKETVHLSESHKNLILETWPILHCYMSKIEPSDAHDSIQVCTAVSNQNTHKHLATAPTTAHALDGATRIFLRIFELSPAIKAVFGFGPEIGTEDMLNDSRLKAHAHRFTEAINIVTDHLNSLDTHVARAFIHLGKQHIHFQGIEASHFDVFSGAFMYVCRQALRDQFTDDVSAAWRRLFDYLLQHLQFGYLIALDAEKSTVDDWKCP